MAKKANCPKCANVIEYADTKPASCPFCKVKFRSEAKPAQPSRPPAQADAPLSSPPNGELPGADPFGASIPPTDWSVPGDNLLPLDSAFPLDAVLPIENSSPLDGELLPYWDPLSFHPVPAELAENPFANSPEVAPSGPVGRPLNAPAGAPSHSTMTSNVEVTVESPRVDRGRYGVLGACLLTLAVTMLLLLVLPAPQPAATAIGKEPDDPQIFPELALVMKLTPDELAKMVRLEFQEKPEAELITELGRIAAGQSNLDYEYQMIFVEVGTLDKRPAVALASVGAIGQLRNVQTMKRSFGTALTHDDVGVSNAAIAAAVKLNDELSVEVLFDAWRFAASTKRDPSRFLKALPQMPPQLVHPLVFAQREHPDMQNFIRDNATDLLLGDLIRERCNLLLKHNQLEPSTDRPETAENSPERRLLGVLNDAIVVNWQQNANRRKKETFRFVEENLKIGEAAPIPAEIFLRVSTIEALRDEVTKALEVWPKTWRRPNAGGGPSYKLYYSSLEKWGGRSQEELVSADLRSEDDLRRQIALSEIDSGRTTAGVKTFFEMWSKSPETVGYAQLSERLQDSQSLVVAELISSEDPKTSELAMRHFESRVLRKDVVDRLFENATRNVPRMTYARHTVAESLRRRSLGADLEGEQIAKCAIIAFENPLLPNAFLVTPPSLRQIPASRKDELVCKVAPYLIAEERINITDVEATAWEQLLAIDSSNVLGIVETEIANSFGRRQDEYLSAVILSRDERACQLLVRGLLDERLRKFYVVTLMEADFAAEPALIKALASPAATEPIKEAICQVLSQTCTAASKEALEPIAKGESPAKKFAEIGLKRIQMLAERKPRQLVEGNAESWARHRQNLPSHLSSSRTEPGARNASSPAAMPVEEALRRMNDGDARSRLNATRALSLSEVDVAHRKQVLETTAQAIDPANVPLSWYAIQAQGHWGGEQAVAELSTLLKSENPYVVVAAAKSLAKIATADSAKALAELLESPRYNVVGRFALVRLGRDDPQLVADHVIPLLDHEEIRVRLESVTVVSRLGLDDGAGFLKRTYERYPEFMAFERDFFKNNADAAIARRERKRK